MKVVVLCSGGLDSTLMTIVLRSEGDQVLPLHINFGQLCEGMEASTCLATAKRLGLPTPEIIDVSGLRTIPSSLTQSNLRIVDDAFFPTRNLMFLVIGAAYGFGKRAEGVAIGLLANPMFPDQRPEFVRSAQSAIEASLGREMKVLAPFIKLDKRDVIRLARDLNLSLDAVYSCHRGAVPTCGECISCIERRMALESLSSEEDKQRKGVSA